MTTPREAAIGQNGLPERPHQGAVLFRMGDDLGRERIGVVIEVECAAIHGASAEELQQEYFDPSAYVRRLVGNTEDLPVKPEDLHDAGIVVRATRPTVRARALELGIAFEEVALPESNF